MLVEALYDFKGDAAGKQLSFLRREILEVTETCPNGWAKGFKLGEEGSVGYFPIKYVQEKKVDEAAIPLMFVYAVKYKYETERFSVEPGEKLISLSTQKDGWMYCMRLQGGKRDYVPVKYVEQVKVLCAMGRCRNAFSKADAGYLNVEERDTVCLLYEFSKDFVFCSNESGAKGLIPVAYLEYVAVSKQTEPRCKDPEVRTDAAVCYDQYLQVLQAHSKFPEVVLR